MKLRKMLLLFFAFNVAIASTLTAETATWLPGSLLLELRDGGIVRVQQFDALGRSADGVVDFYALSGKHRYPINGLLGSYSWLRIITPNSHFVLAKNMHRTTAGAVVSVEPDGMVRIPPGFWTIGSPDGEIGRWEDENLHRIYLSEFWIDTVEVTRKQFKAIMGYDPSINVCSPDCPVNNVTWYESIVFCNARSIRMRRIPAYDYENIKYDVQGRVESVSGLKFLLTSDGFRLPTEAQWEVAARAGSSAAWYWGNDSLDAEHYAWSIENSTFKSRPVAALIPNAWHLYDMLGNVSEWTWDWYDAYRLHDTIDPEGTSYGEQRVFRGGSFENGIKNLRVALRNGAGPSYRSQDLGFRCVRPAF